MIKVAQIPVLGMFNDNPEILIKATEYLLDQEEEA